VCYGARVRRLRLRYRCKLLLELFDLSRKEFQTDSLRLLVFSRALPAATTLDVIMERALAVNGMSYPRSRAPTLTKKLTSDLFRFLQPRRFHSTMRVQRRELPWFPLLPRPRLRHHRFRHLRRTRCFLPGLQRRRRL